MPAAILAGHFMAGRLYDVKPWDPAVLAETTVILGLAAFVAAVLPAQRAAGIEPMVPSVSNDYCARRLNITHPPGKKRTVVLSPDFAS
jgi:hypothetical protein